MDMKNIFAGLESFGLKGTNKVDVFQEKTDDKSQEKGENKDHKKEVTEEDLLFEKSYTCPVCDNEFKSKMVRTGKVRLAGADTDLRPKYMGVDALKYDAVLCPKCGYAALNRYFNFIMARQAANIKEQISKTFSFEDKEDKVYSYDDAIMRHKLALLNTVVKNGKNSERAYTCLKLAWLYRGKREMLLQQAEYNKDEVMELATEEKELLTNAYEGFESAFSKEDFPMCGMDQYTLLYLLAELARRIGDNEAAARHVSKVLVGKNVQKRIKDKAVDLKEKLHAAHE
jgi:Uncharacterized protein conserved in bacteria